MNHLDTDYLLHEWGIWLRTQAGVSGYVSPAYALMRDNLQQYSAPAPDISDDTALLIDRLVCRLYQRYPEAGTALWNHYRYGMTYYRIGKLMGCTHVKAAELVKVGRAWVDSALCCRLAA